MDKNFDNYFVNFDTKSLAIVKHFTTNKDETIQDLLKNESDTRAFLVIASFFKENIDFLWKSYQVKIHLNF